MPNWTRGRKGEYTEETPLFEGDGTLYCQQKDYYKPFGDNGSFTIQLVYHEGEVESGYSSINVLENEELIYTQPIGNGLTLNYNLVQHSVHWPALVEDKLTNMAFKFEDSDAIRTAEYFTSRFVDMYNRCTYALFTQTKPSTVDEDDESFEYMGGIATAKIPNESYDEPVYQLDTSHEMSQATGSGNVCSLDFRHYNSTCVLRKLQNNSLEFQAHAVDENGFTGGSPSVLRLKGTCDAALMDDSERKILLMDIGQNQIREVDAERGQIVQEFTPSEDYPIKAFTYANHVATPDPVYTCLSGNATFNIDLRMDPRNNIDIDPSKTVEDYALLSLGKKELTCHATTTDGCLVTGDKGGNVRLYTGPPGSRRANGLRHPKTAKTLLAIKVPIVQVDVTSNGEWVLAVCPKYLLLMKTTYDDDGRGTNGFHSRMGKKKPAPLMLQPSSHQIDAVGGIERLEFTTGGFDRYGGTKEVCITATSGKHIFTWSLDASIQAEREGHMCHSECAVVGGDVIGVSTAIPGRATYLTHKNIHIAPLKRKDKSVKGISNYMYSK